MAPRVVQGLGANYLPVVGSATPFGALIIDGQHPRQARAATVISRWTPLPNTARCCNDVERRSALLVGFPAY
jgi:hypothetical protein